jgi:hypothetical protein
VPLSISNVPELSILQRQRSTGKLSAVDAFLISVAASATTERIPRAIHENLCGNFHQYGAYLIICRKGILMAMGKKDKLVHLTVDELTQQERAPP